VIHWEHGITTAALRTKKLRSTATKALAKLKRDGSLDKN
jgi:hypothetical protein